MSERPRIRRLLLLLAVSVTLIGIGWAARSDAQTSYKLTAIADPSDGSGGYVEIIGGLVKVADGAKLFRSGDVATVQAHTNAGWRFVRWSGDVSGTSTRRSLTMNGNKIVTAHWERAPQTRTLSAIADPSDGSGGYVEIHGGTLVRAGTKRFGQGERVTIEARPNSGWRFVGWSGHASGTSASTRVTMSRDKTVTARFERIPTATYTLTAIADPSDGSGGYVEIHGGTLVRAGTKRFNQGEQATVEARPRTGWRFAGWSGALGGSSARQSLRMNGNQKVTARFERNPAATYTLTAIADPSDGSGGYVEIVGGTSVRAGTKRFNQGEHATVEARPTTGWRFAGWSGHASGTSASTRVTMTGDRTVVATFRRESSPQYRLTVSTTGSGTVRGAGTYNDGQRATLTTHPSTGWRFARWRGDASGTSSSITVTIDSDKQVEAVFERAPTPNGSFPYLVDSNEWFELHSDTSLSDLEIGDIVKLRVTATNAGGGRVPDGTPVSLDSQNRSALEPLGGTSLTTVNGEMLVRFVVLSLANIVLLTIGGDEFLISTVGIGIQEHQVTATIAPSNAGKVNGGGKYGAGRVARLQAVPNEGFRFLRWEGGATGSRNPISLRVNSNLSVRAVFERQTYTLTAIADPSSGEAGYVEITAVRGRGTLVRPGTISFDAGERVNINVRTSLGWTFERWSGDVASTSVSAQTIVMDSDKTVTAHWIQKRTELFGRDVDDQNWDVGKSVNLQLPSATGGPGPFTYSIKHEWDGLQRQGLPTGLRFNSNTRRISGTPSDPRPDLRRFTVFYKVEDRVGAYDELAFVVNLRPAPIARPRPSTSETISARIVARRLADGRIELALEPPVGDPILPRSRRLPASPTVGRWIDTSNVVYEGQTLGQISARRLANGRTEFGFLPNMAAKRLLPENRIFPSGTRTTNWRTSSWIEIPQGEAPDDPIVSTNETTTIPATQTSAPSERAQAFRPTNVRDYQYSLRTLGIKVKARYHRNTDEIELRLISTDLRVLDQRELRSEDRIRRSELQDGEWHETTCFVLPNANCVSPSVRITDRDTYEFAIRYFTSSRIIRLPDATFSQDSFERDRNIFHNWKETGAKKVPIVPAWTARLHNLAGETAEQSWLRVRVQNTLLNFDDLLEEDATFATAYGNYRQALDVYEDIPQSTALASLFYEGLLAANLLSGLSNGGLVEALAHLGGEVFRHVMNEMLDNIAGHGDSDQVAARLRACESDWQGVVKDAAQLYGIEKAIEDWIDYNDEARGRGGLMSLSDARHIEATYNHILNQGSSLLERFRSGAHAGHLRVLLTMGEEVRKVAPGVGRILDHYAEIRELLNNDCR